MDVKHPKPPVPAGFELSASVTSTAVVTLTVPDDVRYALVKVITAPIRFRDDGVAPTSVSGFTVATSGEIELTSREQIDGFQAIAVDSAATLEVLYYKLSA